ncbi:MAG: DUF4180 domain-containing protein [Phycisphaerales bacterium]|nr:DUF4180 domain-containing protein [Hyphomonadaceae bacterium]
MIVYNLHGERVAEVGERGAPLDSERDAVELIAEAISSDARFVAIPAERLSQDFFRLSTKKAGEFIQKFVNYRLRLAILGDISTHVQSSEPLAAFVAESNRGKSIWFVRDSHELHARLAPPALASAD